MQRCNIENPEIDWLNVMDIGCGQWKTKRIWGALCRLVLQAAVYHLWRLRNDLCHGNTPRTEETLVAQIQWEVRSRLLF